MIYGKFIHMNTDIEYTLWLCYPSLDIGYRSWSVILAKMYWQWIMILACWNISYRSWFPSQDIGYIS